MRLRLPAVPQVQAIVELSRRENVHLKIGGFALPAFGPMWTEERPSSMELADRWGHDVRWAIETMGPHRCLFESNFPLDRRVFSYTRLWNGFKRMIGGGSPSEKRALLYENATRFYDIDETIVTSP